MKNRSKTIEEELLNNPNLKNIDRDKLNKLMKFASLAGSKSNDELLPFLMSTMKGGADFNDAETEVILEVLKTKMSSKEIKKIETIRSLAKMISAKSKKR